MQILCSGLSKILDGLLYSYLHPQSVADEVTGWWWQVITAIHDGGDGLTLCEWLSQDYDLHLLLYCLQIVVLEISFLIGIMSFAQSLVCFYKVGVISDSHYALTLSFLLMMYDLDAKFTTSSSRVVWVSFALNHGLPCVGHDYQLVELSGSWSVAGGHCSLSITVNPLSPRSIPE
jgi:hypothetical protein